MAYVTLTNITVLDNPTAFTNPFQFEVTFECAQQLEAGSSPLLFILLTHLLTHPPMNTLTTNYY